MSSALPSNNRIEHFQNAKKKENPGNMQKIVGEKNDKEIVKRSSFGGLTLFILAFPLINIFLTELYSYIAEGTWRLPFRERSATTAFMCYWITIIPWVILLRRYKKWAERRRVFRIGNRIGSRAWILLGVLLGGFLVFRFIHPHESSLLSTYRLHEELWGQAWGIIITASLYFYYFFEGVMMAWITDAFQTAGESLFHKIWIPWGGIGLALTWGVLHFFTKGLSMGIVAVFFGFFAGVLFVLGQRNTWPPVVAWMLNYFY
jgi:hypothetical protein